MKHMNPKHTTLRNGRYYYYCKIPTSIQPVLGRKMITKSLNTNNIDVATVEAAKLHIEHTNTFQSILVNLANGVTATCDTVKEASELVNAVTSTTTKPTVVVPLMLGDAIDQYLAYKEPNWSSKSLYDNTNTLSLLLFIVGNNDVTSINASDAELYRTTLSKLPPLVPKLVKQGYSIKDILSLGRTPRQVSTTNKQFIIAGGLFNWLADRDSITKSYFKHMLLKDKRSIRDIRLPFTPLELTTAFTELHRLYKYNNTKHDVAIRTSVCLPHHYWIPITLLYTGARLNEIAQLSLSDIDLTNNTISINSLGDKKVKSVAGERLIPIHNSLIKLGFLDYVNTAASLPCTSISSNYSSSTRLFPLLSKMSDGYGHSMGAWWIYNIKNKLNVPTLHSLRHTFINELTQHQVNEHVIAAIVGHKLGGISHNRYSSNYDIEILRDAVNQVSIDLSSILL